MSDHFTIRVFVADGDPEGVRIVDRMNWTGVGVVFPRERWGSARLRPELARAGVCVLVGYKEGDKDLPTRYIGDLPLRPTAGSHQPDRLVLKLFYGAIWCMLNLAVFVETDAGRRALLYMDSVCLSGEF